MKAIIFLMSMVIAQIVLAAKPTAQSSYILRYDARHHPIVADHGMVVSQNLLSSSVARAFLNRVATL